MEAPKLWMNFENADRLSYFKDDWVFFSPALLYLFGHFHDAPLLEFLNLEEARGAVIGHHRFRKPIFLNMLNDRSDDAWNYVLWGVPRPYFRVLDDVVLSTCMYDPNLKSVCRVGAQDIEIIDPLFADHNPGVLFGQDVPKLSITVYAVDGAARCFAVDPNAPVPPVKALPPTTRAQRIRQALKRGISVDQVISDTTDAPQLPTRDKPITLRYGELLLTPEERSQLESNYRKAFPDAR